MFTEGSNDEKQVSFNSNLVLILSSEVNKSNPILLLTLVFTIETREKNRSTTALVIGKQRSFKANLASYLSANSPPAFFTVIAFVQNSVLAVGTGPSKIFSQLIVNNIRHRDSMSLNSAASAKQSGRLSNGRLMWLKKIDGEICKGKC